MARINIAICDDEPSQISYLKLLVEKWARENTKTICITPFDSAEAFKFAWIEDKSFNILLLDIQMGGGGQNGIELAKDIRKYDETLSIIFITGLPEYMSEGYEVSALHYLMKPVNEANLYRTLDKACQLMNKEQKSILISSSGENIRILLSDILYIEAFAHTIQINTSTGNHEVKMSISHIEGELDTNAFVRCHRSYIVGLKYITRISKTDVALDNGISIPLSRRMYNDVNRSFINYFKGVK